MSDEGYGHIVRQNAIIKAIEKKHPDFSPSIQTHKHLSVAQRIIENAHFEDIYNNISWFKRTDGSPDVAKIKTHFQNYPTRSKQYISENIEGVKGYDFLISDFVYEVSEMGEKLDIKTFGVAHFTWDWFFSKLFPPPLSEEVLSNFFALAKKFDILFFPPFTPPEILDFYNDNACEVPFIIDQNRSSNSKQLRSDAFKVLIIDSGAGVLSSHIQKALLQISKLSDFFFYASETFSSVASNIEFISKDELFIDYISGVDLVIARPGFNTITECIAHRTPMLLIGEDMNPEIIENSMQLKKVGLASFISLKDFSSHLSEVLPMFIKNEYQTILERMKQHTFALNGADVIASHILNDI